MSILYLDLETTSSDPETARIVQIALAVDNEYPKVNFVNPQIPIPPESTAIHGITDDIVKGEHTFTHIASSVHAMVASAEWIAGYNVRRFDLQVLSKEFSRVGIDWPREEVKIMDAFLMFMKWKPRHLSDAVLEYLGREQTDAHDAFGDVIDVRDVLHSMRSRHADDFDSVLHETSSQTVDLSGKLKRVDGNLVFNFGKHQGQRVIDQTDYAKWMLRSDFPSQTKWFIRQEIER